MSTLVHQRCFNHRDREAVARCPECGSCFCRECVTEHDDRVICAACLKNQAAGPLLKRPALLRLIQLGQVLFGLLAAWFFFQLMGDILLGMPSTFHEGSVWKERWLDTE